MSMPEAKFICTKCDELNGLLYGPRKNTKYLFWNRELPMDWDLGYCPSCNKIGRFIEHVPTSEEMCQSRVQLLIDYTKDVAGLKNFLIRFLSSNARRRKTDYFEGIRDLNILEELIHYRRDDEFCYHCGARDVVLLDFKSKLKYGESMYSQGEQDIEFEHPGCGGKVILKALDMRFAYTWPDKVLFDETGTRILQ